MDYETFGEHQWKETGIFDFMSALPAKVLKNSPFKFATPSELGEKLQPVSAISVPYPVSWADEERDITAWLGNEMQDEAFDKLYSLESKIRNCNDPQILEDWYKLQNSDHFYYMCTKWFSDGDVHKYFNPYNSPYEAFINYMNVLSDFTIRVNEKYEGEPVQKIIEKSVELGKEISEVAKKATTAAVKKMKEVFEEQKEKSYSFEELRDLSNDKIKKLAKEIDIESWVYALKDAGDELTDKVLPNFSKKAVAEYENLKQQIKVKKTDINKSRKKISDEISRLFSK
jgi:alpha-amylase/alpha-mannosidase (GH57 family)